MVQVSTSSDSETDLLRLNDLAERHGLACRIKGTSSYYFDYAGTDAFSEGYIFVARGLGEALAFAEGFDRARTQFSVAQSAEDANAEELRKLGTFTTALRKSGLADG